MTRKQEILIRLHGTVPEFAQAVWKCGEITGNEGRRAIVKYEIEFEEAGKFTELVGPQKITFNPVAARIWARARKFARIGITNGCFDILHAGHVRMLLKAKSQCDYLIVLMNSTSSVHQLKGPHRPFNGETHRALVLSVLEPVDLVVVFEETRITKWLQRLQPDVWFKGGDYTEKDLNRAEVEAAKRIKCKISIIPRQDNLSTTALHGKIIKAAEMDKDRRSTKTRR